MSKKYNILLSYVSFPIAPAVYFERAFRQSNNVTTCGPNTPEILYKNWDVESLLPVAKPLDITCYNFTPDVNMFFDSYGQNSPDLFLWIESVAGYLPLNIEKINCPTACYLIDSHLNLDWHVRWAKYFNYVFVAQKEYIPAFKSAGCKNVYWLPLGCDPEIHSPHCFDKKYDVGFVGTMVDSRRIELTKKIDEHFDYHYEQAFLKDMSAVFEKSKIVFNNAIKNDLNMRFFETLSIGSLLLSDFTKGNGQEEMFVDGEDYVAYNDDNILEKIYHYLLHDYEREYIAKTGRQTVLNAHTYQHRTAEIVKVCLENQKDTPSGAEWRRRSKATSAHLI